MRKITLLGPVALVGIMFMHVGVPSGHGQTVAMRGDGGRFIGTWRLVSDASIGVMIYDNLGNMAVQTMPKKERRKFAAAQPTPDEAKEAMTGYLAYFGTYTVDENARTITHHRQGSVNPGLVGQDAVRHYEFGPNDQLFLVPVESGNRIVWQRAK